MSCKVCEERQKEISRILSAYKKDKKKYQLIIIIQFVLLLLVTAFGADGIKIAIDIAKGIIK